MKNIIRIFTGDVSRLRHNVIGLIILLGLLILPCMYAWFNIAASWSPYDNTGNLDVAVANTDEGYQSDLMPMEINVGDKVVSALHENDNIHWIFTSEKEAIKGTRSGKYYAALVISKDFSKDIMGLFSNEESHPVITYYSNQKVNAISPKVTDKASAALQETIGESFMETLSQVTINSLGNASAFLDEAGMEEGLSDMDKRLKVLEKDIDATADVVDALINMTESLEELCNTTEEMAERAGSKGSSDRSRLKDAASKVNNLSSEFDNISNKINSSLSDSIDTFSSVENKIDKNFKTLKGDRKKISANLRGMADDIQILIDRYKDWQEDLTYLQENLELNDLGIEKMKDIQIDLGNETGSDPSASIEIEIERRLEIHRENERKLNLVRQALQRMILKLDKAIARQEGLKAKLENADRLLSSVGTDIKSAKKDLKSDAADCRRSLAALRDDYRKNVKADLGYLSNLLSSAGSDTQSLRATLDKTADDSGNLLRSVSGSLTDLKKILEDTSDDLRQASDRMGKVIDSIKDGVDSEDLDLLKDLLSQDGELLASLWASPVRTDTHLVYKIENYGSSMAPFYTALSIWVGGVVMVSMIKTMLSKKRLTQLEAYGKVNHTEQYLGRYLIFLAIGLVQATLICLGNLYFLGIQCVHPFLFLLTGWLSSAVYVMIIYTLTISFGDIGKAICVVLMVMQVAGSGGTFPIETAPTLFRMIYPFLPFVHTMDALRECIAGMYHNTYWKEMGILLLYLIPALLLGLVLRRPIIRLNHFFEEKLEEVRFM